MNAEAFEIPIRVGSFAIAFIFMFVFERLSPRRRLSTSRIARWLNNLSLHAINILLIRGLFPVVPIGMAAIAARNGWGVINHYHLQEWAAVIAGAVFLDLVIYLQHVAFHTVPMCWRLHMVHHTDMDVDLTTGVRFHPVEMILSLFIKMAAIVLSGAPPLAVLIFEVVLNGGSIFTHGNVYIPGPLDRLIRIFFVTPDMHRVHHSVIIRETNTNFGFNLSLWDRIMGTYQDQPKEGHEGMTIGLGYFRDEKKLSLPWLLILPLTRKKIRNLSVP
ncbi:MAG TPA: sterol desaturase family protein [Syntrophales bacterium]|nr:sterol desaturase family protein [Syntrophales bacterium]